MQRPGEVSSGRRSLRSRDTRKRARSTPISRRPRITGLEKRGARQADHHGGRSGVRRQWITRRRPRQSRLSTALLSRSRTCSGSFSSFSASATSCIAGRSLPGSLGRAKSASRSRRPSRRRLGALLHAQLGAPPGGVRPPKVVAVAPQFPSRFRCSTAGPASANGAVKVVLPPSSTSTVPASFVSRLTTLCHRIE